MKKVLCLLGIISILFAFSACGPRDPEEVPTLIEPVKINFDTAEVKNRELKYERYIEGSVRASYETVWFEGTGVIQDILVSTGQYTNAGDVIMRVSGEFENEILGKETEARRLQEQYSYKMQLLDIDIQILNIELAMLTESEMPDQQSITSKQLEIEAKALEKRQETETFNNEYEKLSADIETLKTKSQSMEITSPVSGYVMIEEHYKIGSMVTANQIAAYVMDDSHLCFYAEEYFSEASLGANPYSVIINGSKTEVRQVHESREFIVARKEAKLPLYTVFEFSNQETIPPLGASGFLIIEYQMSDPMLSVPLNAVFRDNGNPYVYKIIDGEKVYTRVTIGASDYSFYGITEGLQEGDIVYVGNSIQY